MPDTSVDIDKRTHLEVRGRLLFCVRSRRWRGIDIVVSPLERVRLGARKDEMVLRWALSGFFALGVGVASVGLWSLGASVEIPVTIVLMGFLIGMNTYVPAIASDIRAWWLGNGHVRLVFASRGAFYPYSVNYPVGLDPAFDSLIEDIRTRQGEAFFPSPAGVQFKYVSVRGEILGLLLDLSIPASLTVVLVTAPWPHSQYLLLALLSVWVAVIYGPSILSAAWRAFASRRIGNAERALIDGEYETAALISGGLPPQVLQNPHTLNLLAAIALLRGDLDTAAESLEAVERSVAYQVAFGTSFSRFGFRMNAAVPPKPESIRKLAAYANGNPIAPRQEGWAAVEDGST